ncbi:Lysophospholipase, alpha-beta hydrolase superfamily [Paraoerskovia marina]|uniref:Lysophospholipase, alpha-beta hydrolase superfamily n=1 Tax=Paraoerskovia marina TaxID=545619 RepID=A0A1H1SP44_9CELL|nr:alpha/beta fold hydrolase [Paraoerskovia marina]SDS49764.1 Lysophospholipase, alpha-beta hydrolase superfamily [Paraoerskovia marina]
MTNAAAALPWAPDAPLGGTFESAPIASATLVRPRRTPSDPRGVVVHLHGYNDYFFQAHLAEAFTRAGFVFYAVDARRAGRSLRPGEVPHYQSDLHEQATDLSTAVALARAAHPGLPLIVHAHSTGGLVAALWAHSHRERRTVDALVLNSPFLDVGASSWLSPVAFAMLDVAAPLSPMVQVTSAPSWYATYQHVEHGGRWDFDTALKRPQGLPARAGWLRAVVRGQVRLAAGLEVGCPVLVAHSASSGIDSPDNPLLDAQDTVLDVAHIERLAPRLGDDVRTVAVEGGVHDLSLSAPEPRALYLDEVLSFAASAGSAGGAP